MVQEYRYTSMHEIINFEVESKAPFLESKNKNPNQRAEITINLA